MVRGSKAKYTDKQKRQAEHIEESVEKRGGGKKTAQRIAWATVNKETGGGEKHGKKVSASRQRKARKSVAKSAVASRKRNAHKPGRKPLARKKS